MEILLTLSGFIFACSVALLYECKIRQIRKEPRNKVRFYICKTTKGNILSLKNKIGLLIISIDIEFEDFGLDPDDFADMKEGELREVYLDLED